MPDTSISSPALRPHRDAPRQDAGTQAGRQRQPRGAAGREPADQLDTTGHRRRAAARRDAAGPQGGVLPPAPGPAGRSGGRRPSPAAGPQALGAGQPGSTPHLVREADGRHFTMTVGGQAYRIMFHPEAPNEADLHEASEVIERLMAVAHDIAQARGMRPSRITFAEGSTPPFSLFGRDAKDVAAEVHVGRDDENFPEQAEIIARGLADLRRLFSGRIRFSAEPLGSPPASPGRR